MSSRRPLAPKSAHALRGWVRISAFFALICTFLVPLGEVVHTLLVPHAVCAEHGELVETEADAHATESEPGHTEHDERQPPAREHQHCQVFALGHQGYLPLESAATLLMTEPPSVAVPVRAAPVAGRTLELLHYAPKTSPPARA